MYFTIHNYTILLILNSSEEGMFLMLKINESMPVPMNYVFVCQQKLEEKRIEEFHKCRVTKMF